jgi:hypothetical protein
MISPTVQSIVPILLIWFHPQYKVLYPSSWYDFTISTKYCPPPPGMISLSVQIIVPILLILFHPQYKLFSPSSWSYFTLSTNYCPHPPSMISPSVQSIVPSSWYDFTLSTNYCLHPPTMISPSVQNYCPHPPAMISPSVQSIVPLLLIWFHPQYKILSPSWYDFTLSTKYCPLASLLLCNLTLSIKLVYDMIYLLTAIGLTPGGCSTVHIYT